MQGKRSIIACFSATHPKIGEIYLDLYEDRSGDLFALDLAKKTMKDFQPYDAIYCFLGACPDPSKSRHIAEHTIAIEKIPTEIVNAMEFIFSKNSDQQVKKFANECKKVEDYILGEWSKMTSWPDQICSVMGGTEIR